MYIHLDGTVTHTVKGSNLTRNGPNFPYNNDGTVTHTVMLCVSSNLTQPRENWNDLHSSNIASLPLANNAQYSPTSNNNNYYT